MAGISRQANGAKIIQFVDGDRRRSMRLGRCSDKTAQSVRLKVESILAARASCQPLEQESAAWLGKIDGNLHDRLVRVGLVQPRQSAPRPVTLRQFLDGYFVTLGTQKPTTARNNLRARRLLEEYLGSDRTLDSITEGDADGYHNWRMSDKNLAKSGIGRDISRAKTFFKAAARRRLIPVSPFAHVQCPSQTNPNRKEYVPAEVMDKVMAACPDDEWRLIFAFARYAGLRIPSEIVGLKWSDIRRDRFTVKSTKTEHHAGHETRTLPIFPRLQSYLEAARATAKPDCEYFIPRAKSGPNLRTYADQILKRAGVRPWKKLFVNLRASCEADLLGIPALRTNAVLAWMGHSATVALQHYDPGPQEFDVQAALQNPVQSAAVLDVQEPSTLHGAREKSVDGPKDAQNQYPRQGENKPGFTREKSKGRGGPGTQSGTTSGSRPAGLKKTAKKAKRANGRKGGAR